MKKINLFSSTLTKSMSLPAAKAMLYATGLNDSDMNKAQIAIVSNWYEGNPCNMHLNNLASEVKKSIYEQGLIGFRFNTIGVSDGITMGTSGMKYSLPSRELIADSIETMVTAHYHDGVVAIPGCDKNLPGCLIAILRINRPSIIIYGGSIMSGCYKSNKLNIVSAFEAYGKFLEGKISHTLYSNIIKRACPGAGACGGMYTANTMAVILEVLGISLPYSSSNLAVSDHKTNECQGVGKYIKYLLNKHIKPKDIVTSRSIRNAIVVAIALGGSTNLVLHLLAIARYADVKLSLQDIESISNNTPVLADLKPSGKFLMEDIFRIGGTPSIIKYLYEQGLICGDVITVTGKTLKDNISHVPSLDFKKQHVFYPIENPIKNEGHIKILYGNLAPKGAVAKISGKEGIIFKGVAKVFDSEEEANTAILNKNIIHSGQVIVIRYVGPKGGPGMPEMLKPTSYIMGAGLGDKVALITDGRFSGGTHGFVVGHITPEAQIGGPIALVEDNDIIIIDCSSNTINVLVSDEILHNRKMKWQPRDLQLKTGYLYKYYKTVSSANKGCITDDL
jgi:dihydroxy-acid dehydratase